MVKMVTPTHNFNLHIVSFFDKDIGVSSWLHIKGIQYLHSYSR